MLHHVSGLRDWGWITAAAGWPRGSRVHTQDHVLDIMSRQKALNYPPGTEYLYSNTGFNLTAVIVGRVSGEPFPEFTRKALFAPLGMGHTSWRDDFNRIVPGRAVAYAKGSEGYQQQMPFENVYGQGGLLTTVGALLKWNENLTHPSVGGEDLPRQLETPARLADGREIRYDLGLSLGSLRGARELAHSESTAGYRAFPRPLSRPAAFHRGPLQRRVLFAGSDGFRLASPEGEFDEFRRVVEAAPTAAELREYAGEYVSDEAEVSYRIEAGEGTLLLKVRPAQVQTLAPAYRDALLRETLSVLAR